MDSTYAQIRERARQIISRFPTPDFYNDFSQAYEISRSFFKTSPIIAKLQSLVNEQIENDFGHGLKHAVKVTLDAGTLIIVESRLAGLAEDLIDRKVLLVQCAGLLHDIKRKQEDHAVQGAVFARNFLKPFAFQPDEVDDICCAIRNHEAFKETVEAPSAHGRMMSDCLYDADKFRWGPDNFYYTIWDMVSFFNTPLSKFIHLYPKGMKRIEEIKTTFRTGTGEKYGPQFIDIGIAVGDELYDVIQTEFSHLL